MQLYVKDAVTDTGHLPSDVFKGYWMLTFKSWAGVEGQEQGYLPADDSTLQEMSGLDRRAWARCGPRVLGLLKRADDGRYYSKRGVEEAVRLREWSDKSRDGGQRSARLRAARKEGGSHSEEEWHLLLDAAGWKCAICGAPEGICKDHVIPLYRGGSDRIENIQPLCRKCNSAKGPDESDRVAGLRRELNHRANHRLNHAATTYQPPFQPNGNTASASALASDSGPSSTPNGSGVLESGVVGPAARLAAERAEVEWRIGEVWRCHLVARERHYVRKNGQPPGNPPELTSETRQAIRAALKEHDRSRMKPEDRERWSKESPVRAAGIGIFLSKWHTGEDERSSGKFLEPWRPWKHQRGKPDPVPTFADLYFERRRQ